MQYEIKKALENKGLYYYLSVSGRDSNPRPMRDRHVF